MRATEAKGQRLTAHTKKKATQKALPLERNQIHK